CYASPMPALILPLAEAAAHLPARGALIGLDLGTKTIGVAASDPNRRLATGVEAVVRQTFHSHAPAPVALSPRTPTRRLLSSACRSTWTAAKGRAHSRRAPSRATSRA